MKSVAVILAALATATGVTSPAALLTPEAPEGFELADGAAADLTFEEYTPLSPEATAHIEATSAEALAMRAAVDLWTAGEDDILLREITLWTTDEDARAFVEQAVVVGSDHALGEVDSPFEGGVAFSGAEDGVWTRTLTWRQGPYAMTISHFAIEEGDGGTIGDAAETLAEHIETETGHAITAAGAAVTTTTVAATSTSTGGGIPIGTVFLWLVIIVGGIWLIVKIKKLIAARNGNAGPKGPNGATGDDGDGDDVDELIERARARSRAEQEIDAIPDPTVDWNPKQN